MFCTDLLYRGFTFLLAISQPSSSGPARGCDTGFGGWAKRYEWREWHHHGPIRYHDERYCETSWAKCHFDSYQQFLVDRSFAVGWATRIVKHVCSTPCNLCWCYCAWGLSLKTCWVKHGMQQLRPGCLGCDSAAIDWRLAECSSNKYPLQTCWLMFILWMQKKSIYNYTKYINTIAILVKAVSIDLSFLVSLGGHPFIYLDLELPNQGLGSFGGWIMEGCFPRVVDKKTCHVDENNCWMFSCSNV